MLKDTTRGIERKQHVLWLKKTPKERAAAVFGMFVTGRKIIKSSLPKNLSEKEFKRQLYERTYGEPLPEDFFEQIEE